MKLFSQLVMRTIYNMGNSHAVSHYILLLSLQTLGLAWFGCGCESRGGSRSKHLRLKVRNVSHKVTGCLEGSQNICVTIYWGLSALSYLLFVKITNWDGASIIKRLYQVFVGRFWSACYWFSVEGAWFSTATSVTTPKLGRTKKLDTY